MCFRCLCQWLAQGAVQDLQQDMVSFKERLDLQLFICGYPLRGDFCTFQYLCNFLESLGISFSLGFMFASDRKLNSNSMHLYDFNGHTLVATSHMQKHEQIRQLHTITIFNSLSLGYLYGSCPQLRFSIPGSYVSMAFQGLPSQVLGELEVPASEQGHWFAIGTTLCPSSFAKLVYNFKNYGLWWLMMLMVDISILKWFINKLIAGGVPPCRRNCSIQIIYIHLWDPHFESCVEKRCKWFKVSWLFFLTFSAFNARKLLESGPQHCGQVLHRPIQE